MKIIRRSVCFSSNKGSLTEIIFILGIVFWQIRRVMRVDPAKIIAKE